MKHFSVFQIGSKGKFIAVEETQFDTQSTIKKKLADKEPLPDNLNLDKLNWYHCSAASSDEAVQQARDANFEFRPPTPKL